jgi:nucleotide-binding universal stress UspA family protein
MSAAESKLKMEKILFPTDLSEGSLAVFPYAADLARLRGGKVTVLYLADLVEAGINQPLPLVSIQELEKSVLEAAQEHIDEVKGVFEREEVDYEAVTFPCDSVADAIKNYARKYGTDVVVMGTHGRTGFTRLLCGSVAEEVVRGATCPVFLVRVV